ncbi:MAG: hypothetical protein ABIO44_06180 [Saprospiraceae bacterium]
MTNKLTTIFLGLTVFIACSSWTATTDNKYFEGKLTFKNTYIIKTDKVESAYLDKVFGKTAETFFKEGNYFEKYDGGFMLWQLYNRQNNKTYSSRNQTDTVYWFDCGQPGQKILRTEINPKKENILGIDCDELVIYYNSKTVSYYYNSDTLKVNPEWYKDFTYLNKNINTEKMKSIYLKYKLEYPDFIANVTATSISWQTIDNKIFSVPIDKILIEDK